MKLAEVDAHDGYELTIKAQPDGTYCGQVTKNGRFCSGSTRIGTRDEVLAEARKYADWHREHGETADEVIPL